MRTLLGTNLWIEQNARQAFNLDTILLAHFSKVPAKSKSVVDIGTGAGALMLYLSEKTKAKIIGVEIQEARFLQAQKNIKLNHLEHQLMCIHQDIQSVSLKNVDYIICNPPFFKVSKKTKLNDTEEDQIARHEITLNLDDLAKHASRILKFGGKLSIIHRPDRFVEIVDVFNQYHLEIKRIRFVYPYQHSEPNHILIEATKNGNPGLKVEPPLIIYNEKHVLTNEMIQIYGGNENVT
ncbi:MAG: tRNA1(Val) (adenine(37)-N6)-methyltransferase [Acholeplasmataceae bacterium]|nr:tRNA1(Val) (adenine(37)-N6)-methyltransferase [Acholeplasmataceae bacterium]